MAGDARDLGLYGFGSSAHIVAQIARHQGRRVFAFTKPNDERAQSFARDLGVNWVGGSDEAPPEPLDAALIFAPAGPLVPLALKAIRRGGTVVCAGIHMTDVPSFPYELLWGERTLRSVANLTRRDGLDFLELASHARLRMEVRPYAFEQANQALDDLGAGLFSGSAVLSVQQ
jgi:propanol-preferring alcohol dehydrogenase